MGRIKEHPVLRIDEYSSVEFFFNGKKLLAKKGEVISSALFAGGIKVFGHHEKDVAAMGIYCANGQCSQCTVIADGKTVKACMTPVSPGMSIFSCEGVPELPELQAPHISKIFDKSVPSIKTKCLIIGAGPAGLSAAYELAEAGINAIIVDDKNTIGGKLTLQTHNFFGSREDCYAGIRGIKIAKILEENLKNKPIEIWTNSTAIGVFVDKKIGIIKNGKYVIVEPETLLIAAGAREKSLAFPGCDLPGIYGAGAFQTLVNRDLIKPVSRIFIIGGGNVGLIAAYHALQGGGWRLLD